jgi:2,4-dienoyl-CoA reductase (NADPH2)
MIARHPAKRDFANLADYYAANLRHLGVTVVLNREAKAEEIAKAGFDIVVTATGNSPSKLELGPTKIPCHTAYDILEGKAVAGRDVLMIGGGATGCECADWLVRDAAISPDQAYFLLTQKAESAEKVLGMLDKSRRRVTVIDIDKVGSGFEQGTAWPLYKNLDRFGVQRYSFARLVSITDDSVEIEAKEPKTREQKARERETGELLPEKLLSLVIPCDTIVTAVSSKANDVLYSELLALGVKAHNIGDSAKAGTVPDAIAGANELLKSF